MAIKKPNGIPTDLLAHVNEFSSGGFILFTFDLDGNPQVTSNFDSQVHASSMQYYLANFVKAIDSINLKNTQEFIIKSRKRKK